MENRHPAPRAPRVSFVSLGCPKALVDSERIMTRLRAEGYELARSHAGADLAVVNTCGFLDSAQAESLAAIGKALNENGKVIVTGCMGAEPEKITARYPRVLAAGVKELLVISQDTSAYGSDLKYAASAWKGREVRAKFLDLARALGELGAWVLLHYVYPYPHVDEVIPLMAEGKVLPYLDIPFQHASLRILKLMKRPAATENTLARIRAWRALCPDITIRSTFIAG